MPGGSSWPYVWLGAAPPLQGNLGTPADAQADVPSCEERVQRRFSALGETIIKWDLVFSEVSIRALGLQVGAVQKRPSSPVWRVLGVAGT